MWSMVILVIVIMTVHGIINYEQHHTGVSPVYAPRVDVPRDVEDGTHQERAPTKPVTVCGTTTQTAIPQLADIVVGVMSAGKLFSRVQAIFSTWGNHFPRLFIFFEHSQATYVALRSAGCRPLPPFAAGKLAFAEYRCGLAAAGRGDKWTRAVILRRCTDISHAGTCCKLNEALRYVVAAVQRRSPIKWLLFGDDDVYYRSELSRVLSQLDSCAPALMGLGRITYDICRSHVRKGWVPGHIHYGDERTSTTVPCPIGTAVLTAGALRVLQRAVTDSAILQQCEMLSTPAYDFLHDGALGFISWVLGIPYNYVLSKWAPILQGNVARAKGVWHPMDRLNLGFISFPHLLIARGGGLRRTEVINPTWQEEEVEPHRAKKLSITELETVFSSATAIHIGHALAKVAPVNVTMHRIHHWAKRHEWNASVLQRVALLRGSGLLEDTKVGYKATLHYKQYKRYIYNLSYRTLCSWIKLE